MVALPASPAYRALQTSLTGDAGPTRLFAKTGLLIRPGVALSLAVPSALRTHARVGWGSPGPIGAQVDIGPCPSAGEGWLVYAGGYYADRPMCLPVVVRARGRQQTVHIGVGAACPGQQPPAQPSDR